MDNGESLDNEQSPPEAPPPRKDHVAFAQPPPMLDEAASIESGDCELGCSHDALQPAGTSWFEVDKSDGSDPDFAVSGSNEFREKLGESKENGQGRLRTDHEESGEMEHNVGPACTENTLCGHETGKLRRQGEEACVSERSLDEKIDSMQHSYDKEIELLRGIVAELEAENRMLVAAEEEQIHRMQAELSRRGLGPLMDVICENLELQLQVDLLRRELLLRDEERQSLDESFHRCL